MAADCGLLQTPGQASLFNLLCRAAIDPQHRGWISRKLQRTVKFGFVNYSVLPPLDESAAAVRHHRLASTTAASHTQGLRRDFTATFLQPRSMFRALASGWWPPLDH